MELPDGRVSPVDVAGTPMEPSSTATTTAFRLKDPPKPRPETNGVLLVEEPEIQEPDLMVEPPVALTRKRHVPPGAGGQNSNHAPPVKKPAPSNRTFAVSASNGERNDATVVRVRGSAMGDLGAMLTALMTNGYALVEMKNSLAEDGGVETIFAVQPNHRSSPQLDEQEFDALKRTLLVACLNPLSALEMRVHELKGEAPPPPAETAPRDERVNTEKPEQVVEELFTNQNGDSGMGVAKIAERQQRSVLNGFQKRPKEELNNHEGTNGEGAPLAVVVHDILASSARAKEDSAEGVPLEEARPRRLHELYKREGTLRDLAKETVTNSEPPMAAMDTRSVRFEDDGSESGSSRPSESGSSRPSMSSGGLSQQDLEAKRRARSRSTGLMVPRARGTVKQVQSERLTRTQPVAVTEPNEPDSASLTKQKAKSERARFAAQQMESDMASKSRIKAERSRMVARQQEQDMLAKNRVKSERVKMVARQQETDMQAKDRARLERNMPVSARVRAGNALDDLDAKIKAKSEKFDKSSRGANTQMLDARIARKMASFDDHGNSSVASSDGGSVYSAGLSRSSRSTRSSSDQLVRKLSGETDSKSDSKAKAAYAGTRAVGMPPSREQAYNRKMAAEARGVGSQKFGDESTEEEKAEVEVIGEDADGEAESRFALQPGAYSVGPSAFDADDDSDYSYTAKKEMPEAGYEAAAKGAAYSHSADVYGHGGGDEDDGAMLIKAVLVDEEEGGKEAFSENPDLVVAEAAVVNVARRRWAWVCLFLVVVGGVLGLAIPLANSGGGSDLTATPTMVPTLSTAPSVAPSDTPTMAPTASTQITILVQLDSMASETGWSLLCDGRVQIFVPPGTFEGQDFRLTASSPRVGIGENCDITVTDAGGDGWDGFYTVYNGLELVPENVIISGPGEDFLSTETQSFVVLPPPTLAPTTSPAPSTSPAPTGDVAPITAFIFLDEFPLETGFTLICNDDVVRNVTAPAYLTTFATVVETYFVPVGAECIFTIMDLVGDGICCGEGGSGRYIVYLGDQLAQPTASNTVAQGGEFAFNETTTFEAVLVGNTPEEIPGTNLKEWTQVGPPIIGSDALDRVGFWGGISDDGTIIAVSSSSYDVRDRPGYVQVYQFDDALISWVQLGEDILGEGSDDNAGTSLSLSADGLTIAIGAIFNDGDDAEDTNRGHVRVFRFAPETNWTQIGQDLDGENPADNFGGTVALSSDGRRLAVGGIALFNSEFRTDETVGYARVFDYDEDTSVWNRVGQDIEAEDPFRRTFVAVSLSGDGSIMAIGFNGVFSTVEDNFPGRLRIFEFDSGNDVWVQLGEDIDGESPGDNLGNSVSLSLDGLTVAAGAPNFAGDDTGYVRVFRYNAMTGWTQVGGDIDGETLGSFSGVSVSLSNSGNVLAVGAPSNDSSGGVRSGHVRVHEFDSSLSEWVQISQDIDGAAPGDMFGNWVMLSGSGEVLAIGSQQFDSSTAEDVGSVQVYERLRLNLEEWTQVGEGLEGSMALDRAGFWGGISDDGTIVAMSASSYDVAANRRGYVRVFRFDFETSGWLQLGEDIDGEGPDDNSGTSLSLSSNGLTIAIGSVFNNGDDLFDTNRGHVRVFRFDSSLSNWVQLGMDLDGDDPADNLGGTVALSSNGNRVAVGAIALFDSQFRTNETVGYVRVFDYDSEADSWNRAGLDVEADDLVGRTFVAVTLSGNGNILAIGFNGVFNTNADFEGLVRVYEYDAASITWRQLGGDIHGDAGGDNFGNSVSLSLDGMIVASGAPNFSGRTSGYAQVYEYDAALGWIQMGGDIDGEGTGSFTGVSVSLSNSGTVLAVGAPLNNGSNGPFTGHTRIHEYDATARTWSQISQDIDGSQSGDQFGSFVMMSGSGDFVAIGAQTFDGVAGQDSGQLQVYRSPLRNDAQGIWTLIDMALQGSEAGDRAGFWGGISDRGTVVAFSASSYDTDTMRAGYVQVYEFDLFVRRWLQLGDDIVGEGPDDNSGTSMSLSADGLTVAVGAVFNDGDDTENTNRGHVRVFQYTPETNWTQLGQDLDGESAADNFGGTVVLSNNGRRLAVGAIALFDSPFRTNETVGYARVFDYNEASDRWSQVGQDIEAEDPFRRTFVAVALSGDGNIMAIGFNGVFSSPEANFSGRLRMYEFDSDIGMWVQLGEDIDGESAGDNLGNSVSLSEDGLTVAVGAPNFAGVSAGYVRVFRYSATTGWTQLGGDIDGETLGSFSGVSVSLSNNGNVLAVGAPLNDGSNGIRSGHARVHEYDSSVGEWVQISQDLDGAAPGDQFGTWVMLSGSGEALAVGAQTADVAQDDDGQLQVYRRPGVSPWLLVGQVIEGQELDRVGFWGGISDDGTIVALSSSSYDTDTDRPGYVQVFQYNRLTDNWVQMGEDIVGEGSDDNSGTSMSLSADGLTVAVGAVFNDGDDTENTNRGHVRVFQYTPETNWTQLGQDLDGESAADNFGGTVVLSNNGRRLAVGAIALFDSPFRTNETVGYARVFDYNEASGRWSQVGQDIEAEDPFRRTFVAVALSGDGNIMAIGFNGVFSSPEANFSGRLRMYEFDSDIGMWVQLGEDIDGESAGDNLGNSVSLSEDGLTVAVGAPNFAGVSAGYVRVFRYSATTGWTQLGGDIDGETLGSFSGVSVSLSNNGNVLAVGAPLNDGSNGIRSGHARVHEYDSSVGEWVQISQDLDGAAPGDQFGTWLMMSGSGYVVVIGAQTSDTANAVDAGSLSVFARPPS